MPTKLVYFRPTTIAYLRADGACERAIAGTWAAVEGLISRPSFGDVVDRAFGLHWGAGCCHRPAREYEAGIVFTSSVMIGSASPFSTRTLPGGSYVRQTLAGDRENWLDGIADLTQKWTENDNFMLDPRRPTIEVIKLRKPSDFKSAKFEICIPVKPRFGEDALA